MNISLLCVVNAKVHNYKCSYLCCNIILLFSEILLLIEFCFITNLIRFYIIQAYRVLFQ